MLIVLILTINAEACNINGKFDLYWLKSDDDEVLFDNPEATLGSYGMGPNDTVRVQYRTGCCDFFDPKECSLVACGILCFLPTCCYCCLCCGQWIKKH